MKSILSEIYYGNVIPGEQGYRRDAEYGKAMRKLNNCQEALAAKLNDEEKEQLKTFADAQAYLSNIECRELWKQGFCFGIRIGIEIADDSSED